MEGHWKFLGGGGFLKTKFLEAVYENKLEFPGGRWGGGRKTKNLPWWECGYFLELHNVVLAHIVNSLASDHGHVGRSGGRLWKSQPNKPKN